MLPGSSLFNTRPRRTRVFSEDEPARLFFRKNGKENTELLQSKWREEREILSVFLRKR